MIGPIFNQKLARPAGQLACFPLIYMFHISHTPRILAYIDSNLVYMPIFHHPWPSLQSYVLVQTGESAGKCAYFCNSKHYFQLSWAGQACWPNLPTQTILIHFICLHAFAIQIR